MNAARPTPARRRQRGAGLIETMIGILIGLLVVLVVYNLLAVAEDYRRATTGASDAQITGLLSQFITSQDAASAGSGILSGFSTSSPATRRKPTARSRPTWAPARRPSSLSRS